MISEQTTKRHIRDDRKKISDAMNSERLRSLALLNRKMENLSRAVMLGKDDEAKVMAIEFLKCRN